jgi:hypothetical protein
MPEEMLVIDLRRGQTTYFVKEDCRVNTVSGFRQSNPKVRGLQLTMRT